MLIIVIKPCTARADQPRGRRTSMFFRLARPPAGCLQTINLTFRAAVTHVHCACVRLKHTHAHTRTNHRPTNEHVMMYCVTCAMCVSLCRRRRVKWRRSTPDGPESTFDEQTGCNESPRPVSSRCVQSEKKNTIFKRIRRINETFATRTSFEFERPPCHSKSAAPRQTPCR